MPKSPSKDSELQNSLLSEGKTAPISSFFKLEDVILEAGCLQRRIWQLSDIRITYHEGRLVDIDSTLLKLSQQTVTMFFVQKGGIRVEFDGNAEGRCLKTAMQNCFYSANEPVQVWSEELEVGFWCIEFSKACFLEYALEATPSLGEFTAAIDQNQASTLLSRSAFLDLSIQSCLQSILNSTGNSRSSRLFLRAKVLELLAHQTECSESQNTTIQRFVKKDYDRERLLFAKEYLLKSMALPPSLPDLARIAGINEFKLKGASRKCLGIPFLGSWPKRGSRSQKLRLKKDNKRPLKSPSNWVFRRCSILARHSKSSLGFLRGILRRTESVVPIPCFASSSQWPIFGAHYKVG